LAGLGVVAFVIISFELESELGLPWQTTYRIACAAACLFFVHRLAMSYPGESWPRTSFWLCSLVLAGIFFTPLVDGPPSRGEFLLFALPAVIVVLVARIASYSAANDHQRAMRQQMILALVVAAVFCVILFALEIRGSQA
jgi:Na+-translocating ferredoxin:NAD+ oxidoreductase RnfA subunit